MTATIIDGKAIAEKIKNEIKEKIDQRLAKALPPPGLAVILVGSDPASEIYVRNKRNACAATGTLSRAHDLPSDITQETLLALIDELNNDPEIHGILVQSPLPDHIDEEIVIERIHPDKMLMAFTLTYWQTSSSYAHPAFMHSLWRNDVVGKYRFRT